MSGHRALRERVALLAELRQIVQAMRNMAFAELQRVARVRPAQRQASEAVVGALAELPPAPPADLPAVCLVIGAERGFCGAFNAQLVQAAHALAREHPVARWRVAGRRLAEAMAARVDGVEALPGCASLDEAGDALEAWLGAPGASSSWLLHASEGGVARRRLPPDVPARDPAHAGPAPRCQLPVDALRDALRRQAARLTLQQGLLDSLEQENHWRLAQMQRAQDHLDELGARLRRRAAALRQADITNELETLMVSLGDTLAR